MNCHSSFTRALFVFVIALSTGYLRGEETVCFYLPPGGPVAFGFHPVGQIKVSSEVGYSPIWLDDGRIAIGAPTSDQGGSGRGAVWILGPYNSRGADYQTFILPPLPAIRPISGGFGRCVTGSGGWLAANARLTNDSYTVCLFQATNATDWAFRTNLLGNPNASGDNFGDGNRTLVMHGRWLAVIRHEINGRVHLYRRSDQDVWEERQQLTVPGFETAVIPGTALVDMHEQTLVVGVSQNGNNSFTGAAYVWRRDGSDVWNYETNLAPADLAAADEFGTSLALGTNKIFVSARQSDIVTTNAGAIFLFQRQNNAWSEVTRIAPTNLTAAEYIGRHIDYSELGGEWLVDAVADRIRLFQPTGNGNEWKQLVRGFPGRQFPDWESPAGTIKDYGYADGAGVVNSVSIRGHQVMIGYANWTTIMEYGWHAIHAFYFSGDPPCSTRPVYYLPIGAANADGSKRIGDLDDDGISDVAEIYFGTYLITNQLSAGLSPVLTNNQFKVRWPRTGGTNMIVRAQPQWSTNLTQWLTNGLTLQKFADEPNTGREIMEVTLPTTSAAYFRLNLTLPTVTP